MTPITYLTGDATEPQGEGKKMIAHICNDVGGWGRGFVVALSKKWDKPEAQYRAWHKGELENAPRFALGNIQLVEVEENKLWVANMIAQHDTKPDERGMPPIRYDSLMICLDKLAEEALEHKASVHMPRIGCGLAGGNWVNVSPLVEMCLSKKGVPVYVYDLED